MTPKPPLASVLQACADLRHSDRLCNCDAAVGRAPCRSAVRAARFHQPVPMADLSQTEAALEKLGGHYGLADWSRWTQQIVQDLPAVLEELHARRRAMADDKDHFSGGGKMVQASGSEA